MAKRKKPTGQKSAPFLSEIPTGSEQTVATEKELHSGQQPPSVFIRILFSAVVGLHLTAVVVSLASNRAPSYLQGELLETLSPYLATTHQAYGAFPIELTYASQVDFPLDVEVQTVDAKWSKVKLPISNGAGTSGSRWTNLARIITLITTDDAAADILSDIGIRIVQSEEKMRSERIEGIRFVMPRVLSFDEASLAERADDGVESKTIFLAKVVRTGEVASGLMPTLEDYRTSNAKFEKAP